MIVCSKLAQWYLSLVWLFLIILKPDEEYIKIKQKCKTNKWQVGQTVTYDAIPYSVYRNLFINNILQYRLMKQQNNGANYSPTVQEEIKIEVDNQLVIMVKVDVS